MEGIVLRRDEGEEVATRESRSVLIKADLEQLGFTESWYGSRQDGAGPHVHRAHADSFCVLAGELTFFTANGSLTASEGSVFLAPPNVVHGFANERDAEARFLNLTHLTAASSSRCGRVAIRRRTTRRATTRSSRRRMHRPARL